MNTQESTAGQYASMVLERNVVDRARGSGDFLQMFASFEATPSELTPGMKPVTHGAVTFGGTVRGTGRSGAD